jgi:replicative DNA helicase
MTENEIELQPHDIQAERATLGSLLIDPDAILNVRENLHPRDFYVSQHQWLYSAYLTAIDGGNEAPDYVTLCSILDRNGQLEEIGGAAFITSLINQTPTAMNVEHYAQIVARTGYLRRAIAAAQKIAQIGYNNDGGDILTKQEEIEQIAFNLAPVRAGAGLQRIGEAASVFYDQIERRRKGEIGLGVGTGYPAFDKLLDGGLQKSDFIVVAARPSMGKTALMLNIARNASKMHNKNVALFSLEMSKAQIVQRLVASESRLDSGRLRTGRLDDSEWPIFVQAMGAIDNAGIYIDDMANQSASQMTASLRRLLAKVEIDLIVIDYLQCMQARGAAKDLYHKTSKLTKDCKALAKEFNLPVVVGSQLSRACEQRNDKRPIKSDLRDSGTIEEDADVVAFIYRDEYYNPHTDTPNIAEINVAKHRNGPIGMFPLYFHGPTSTFRNIELKAVEF